MPMNGTLMGDEIAAAIESTGVMKGGQTASDIELIWEAIGGAIVAHIQANGVITANGLPTLPVQVVPATGTGATTAPDVVTGTIA